MLRHEEILRDSKTAQRALYLRSGGPWLRVVEEDHGPSFEDVQGEPANLDEAKARLLWGWWPSGIGAAAVAAGGAGNYEWQVGRMEGQLARCAAAAAAPTLEEAKRILYASLSASSHAAITLQDHSWQERPEV